MIKTIRKKRVWAWFLVFCVVLFLATGIGRRVSDELKLEGVNSRHLENYWVLNNVQIMGHGRFLKKDGRWVLQIADLSANWDATGAPTYLNDHIVVVEDKKFTADKCEGLLVTFEARVNKRFFTAKITDVAMAMIFVDGPSKPEVCYINLGY